MSLHCTEPACGLFIVSAEVSELAGLFQLNISLPYAGFPANNVPPRQPGLAMCWSVVSPAHGLIFQLDVSPLALCESTCRCDCN